MIAPGAIVILSPLVFGTLLGYKFVSGMLAGTIVSGIQIAFSASNTGGAWDNAKKSFEKGVEINGEMYYKKSEPHKASVTGDTVGDPFKDTSSVALNPIIKFTTLFGLLAVEIAVSAKETAFYLGCVFFVTALFFVYRSFYGMRITK